jgi:hypothetical protein
MKRLINMAFEFDIDRQEVLRYLKTDADFKDESINKLIDEALEEIKEIINFRYIYKKFPIKLEETGVDVLNTTLFLAGESIKKHLENSEQIYLMAATIGNQVDKRISFYEKTSITKSMILDACATTAIEEGCDYVEEQIKKEVLAAGNSGITFRYSPGYGDLDIDIQQDFLRVLNAPKKIGLTASKYNMLLPSKSVTAVIGVLNNNHKSEEVNKKRTENNLKNKENNNSKIKRDIEFEEKNCKYCRLFKECELRKKGIYCGAKK